MSSHFHICRRSGWKALLAVSMLCNSSLFASGLTSGHYQFQVRYALVCLHGTYPITLRGMTTQCYLSVNTDATGALSGTLNIRTVPGVASGTFASRNNIVSVQVHAVGQDPPNIESDVDAQLSGTSQFIGTAAVGDQSGLATMDVSAAGPLLVTFDLDITVDPQGAVIGAGTASGCGAEVPVNITGSNGPSNCVLDIVGANLPSFVWDGSGPPTSIGFIADWTANGFGAIASGTGLAITAPSPTPTPTASPAQSPTPTATPTSTPTATATATATATYTPTPTPTPEQSPTPTPTATSTPTPTGTATPSATATATATPTSTPTPTTSPPSATPTPTPTPGPGVGTVGYWANHPGAWCVSGIALGCQTYSESQAITIMQHSTSGDMTYPLGAQLAAARLNVNCTHTNSSCVASAITAADSWLCSHPIGSNVKANSQAWREIISAYNTVTNYNEGRLCAPPRG